VSIVFIGTFTEKGSRGIYQSVFNDQNGILSEARLVAELDNPSYLVADVLGHCLYVASETDSHEGVDGGQVVGYQVVAGTHDLRRSWATASGGARPCHLELSRDGQSLAVANYAGGSASRVSVDGPDAGAAMGTIRYSGVGTDLVRQSQSHPHGVHFDHLGRLWVPDLGLDTIRCYEIAADFASGHAQFELQVAPGTGPRHLAFHQGLGTMYVVGELVSQVLVYRITPGSVPELLQTISTLPPGVAADCLAAEILVDGLGRHLYVSNQNHDSIAVFAIDATTGHLEWQSEAMSGGHQPRHMSIDPSGRFMVVANLRSDSLVVFAISPESGDLSSIGASVYVPLPSCVVFTSEVTA
jgi:6-phosphogluconolactonase